MIVNGIDYTNTYSNTSLSKSTTQNSSFDSIFEAEVSIYATPASNGLQADATKKVSTSGSSSSSGNLDSIFKDAASKYNVSESLLKSVAKAESNFNTNAVSSAGAIGIMQLMPSTAESLGVTDPYDATQNIMGGAKLLSQLLKKYNNNTSLALAAYNAGSGNVDKYGGIPPFKETQNYVKKVLAYLDEYSNSTSSTTIYATTSNNSEDTSHVYSIFAQPATSANI